MAGFEETVQDALTIVRLVPRWALAPDQWPAVEDALREMAAAVAARDALAVHRASRRLETQGPTRLSAIPRSSGETSDLPEPPRQVLDLVNSLVHPASGWSTAPSSTATPTRPNTDSGQGG